MNLRVGYGISTPEIAKALNKSRLPFNCNMLAQTAATAALNDENFIESSKKLYKTGAKQITKACRELNLEYIKPHANFILINVGNGNKVFNELLKHGIIVRPTDSFNLPEWIRVSFGTEKENNKFINALKYIMQG